MTPEGKAKAVVRTLLKKHGCYVVMPMTAGMGNSGVSDFICCHKGRFFGVEVKANTQVSALQAANLHMIEQAGGRAFVVRINLKQQTGLDELVNFLENV